MPHYVVQLVDRPGFFLVKNPRAEARPLHQGAYVWTRKGDAYRQVRKTLDFPPRTGPVGPCTVHQLNVMLGVIVPMLGDPTEFNPFAPLPGFILPGTPKPVAVDLTPHTDIEEKDLWFILKPDNPT